jgi:hypothetical protein
MGSPCGWARRFTERMSNPPTKPGFLASLKLRWYRLLEAILHIWVRTRVLPDPLSDLGIDPGRPVCYMLDSYALSSLLILERCCRENGLPQPLMPLALTQGSENRAYGVLRRKKGMIIRRTEVRSHSETLKRLVDHVCEGREEDIQMVPVTRADRPRPRQGNRTCQDLLHRVLGDRRPRLAPVQPWSTAATPSSSSARRSRCANWPRGARCPPAACARWRASCGCTSSGPRGCDRAGPVASPNGHRRACCAAPTLQRRSTITRARTGKPVYKAWQKARKPTRSRSPPTTRTRSCGWPPWRCPGSGTGFTTASNSALPRIPETGAGLRDHLRPLPPQPHRLPAGVLLRLPQRPGAAAHRRRRQPQPAGAGPVPAHGRRVLPAAQLQIAETVRRRVQRIPDPHPGATAPPSSTSSKARAAAPGGC